MAKITFYRSGLCRQWRWRVKAGNNEIIAASTESFKRHQGAENNLKLTFLALREYFANEAIPLNEISN